MSLTKAKRLRCGKELDDIVRYIGDVEFVSVGKLEKQHVV